MIRLLLIFLLPLMLHASKILSYNIYDRTDRVDVMITFDTPYDGVIKQNSSQSKIIIKLEDATIESSKLKQLSSKFLYSLSITPMSNYIQIVATTPPSIKLTASKTSDSYGLRLRFTDQTPKSLNQTAESPQVNTLEALPTKNDDDITQSYYIVIAILIIGILILFFIKKKVAPKNKVNTPSSSWLFKTNAEPTKTTGKNDVSIRFQKTINQASSVVMLDFADQSYLVLMGNHNILLDKFIDNKPTTQDDFETILQNRHKELDEFLKVDNGSKEPFQAYTEKAASIRYEV
ncbi:hypothetical protein KKG72_06980 [bacterium]|nr:hypothetical protein [bacterium]MBU1993994.1 hypothetical protein [bacterium]